jgi:hypothetical protein
VAFIYPRNKPGKIFLEVKDPSYTLGVFRGQLCPIGGNWLGELAREDSGPLDTLRREVGEELCLTRYAGTQSPTSEDIQALGRLKGAICSKELALGTYLCKIGKEALGMDSSGSAYDEFLVLSSYWRVPLDDGLWELLESLQRKFGNLSCESQTCVTSLDEILSSGARVAFGHDEALREFFASIGLPRGRSILPTPGIRSVFAGWNSKTYEECLRRCDIAQRPR